MTDDTITSSQVADILDLSQRRVLVLSDRGDIPCTKDDRGHRVYRRCDIVRLAQRRAEEREAVASVRARYAEAGQ